MSSAAHCGRHVRYRCSWCNEHHRASYHDDVNDLDKTIDKQADEISELRQAITEHRKEIGLSRQGRCSVSYDLDLWRLVGTPEEVTDEL